MYATVRRYEGIDKVRSEEITRKIVQSLVPELSELSGFIGYFVIDAGGGALPNAPRITAGPLVALAPQLEQRA